MSKRQEIRTAINKLKERREKGIKQPIEKSFEYEEDIFDYVDDQKYEEIVKERRQHSDFVVDAHGLGYYDDGEERTFEDPDSGEELELPQEPVKGKKTKRKDVTGVMGANLNKLFENQRKRAKVNVVGPSSFKLTKKNAKDDDNFLDSMLEELDADPLNRKANSRALNRVKKFTVEQNHNTLPDFVETPPYLDPIETFDDIPAFEQDIVSNVENTNKKITPVAKSPKRETKPKLTRQLTEEELEEIGQDSYEECSDGEQANDSKQTQIDTKKIDELIPKTEDKIEAQRASLLKTHAEFVPKPKESHEDCKENQEPTSNVQRMSDQIGSVIESLSTLRLPLQSDEDGEFLDFYWLDAYEDRNCPGIVFLFGKTLVTIESETKYVSCCLTIEGFDRNLFVLPRKDKLEAGKKTDIKIRFPEDIGIVHEEIKKYLRDVIPAGKTRFRCKPVKRKYAFSDPAVPRNETHYLKVVYDAKYPPLSNLSGDTFSHIFGSNTTPLELFLLKRKIMGPCWLRIRSPLQTSLHSWCKLEARVESPKLVSVLSGANVPPPPPLVALSLCMKAVVNPNNQKHEIALVSAMLHSGVNIEGVTHQEDRGLSAFAAVTKAGADHSVPYDFKRVIQRMQSQGKPMKVEVAMSERSMLSFLLAKIQTIDPDVIVGHNLYGFELDLLMQRIHELKIPHWSRLGRLKRDKIPKSIYTSQKQSFVGSIAAGRLLCDTYVSSREFLTESMYSLTHLSNKLLKIEHIDVDPLDVPVYYESSDQLLKLLKFAQHTAYCTMKLMFKLSILPLTKQLTNIAGNLWSKSLNSARADRVEYLLLHEFHRRKYIKPDKSFGRNKNLEMDEEKGKGRRKPAYSGGLVLEPKKGFYDKFVLLLDFNSLYPSIIQEHKICFTTLDWAKLVQTKSESQSKGKPKKVENLEDTDEDVGKDENKENKEVDQLSIDNIDSLHNPIESENGVLPEVIQTLVARRKQVKQMMALEKDPSNKEQLDIRQKALKLIANSMYGCLGFSHSRFFAKPLAELITSRGRSTLQRTVNIAQEKLNLEVIYGDTDSIMINTHTKDSNEAIKIGTEVKRAINRLYKHLELEIDGLFKSMLLLKKKKYAALVYSENNGVVRLQKETKGLDLVRRDWCPLSKEVGNYVLDILLSDAEREDVVVRIHEYLVEIGESVRQGKRDVYEFVITKGLSKAPQDYPDANNQPHVQVALAMAKEGKAVNIGDHIPYVITIGEGSIAERARHPEAVQRSNGEDKVDYEWYLTHQIHPPVSRLCEPIEGMSISSIAHHLGLDTSKFNVANSSRSSFYGKNMTEDDISCVGLRMFEDEEKFKNVEKVKIVCYTCKHNFEFQGAFEDVDIPEPNIIALNPRITVHSCLYCPACGRELSPLNIWTCLFSQIRNYITNYYSGWAKCIETSCQNRTRQLPICQKQCLVFGCKGDVEEEYSSHDLYTQLKYYQSLFDLNRLEQKTRKRMHNSKLFSKNSPLIHRTKLEIVPQNRQDTTEYILNKINDVILRNAYDRVDKNIWRIFS